ncbi:MAG TPA: Npt1/Npt2 family nucleotide transporter [Anaerolineae bacterium]
MSSTRLAAFFQIHPGEQRLVALLVTLMLLPSTGGAMGSPGVEALFFARFGVEFLPYMYVALGIITLVSTLIITALLGRASRKRLYLRLPLALVLFLILARVFVSFDLNWFYPILWLGMYLIWTLQGLLTWGLASMVCTTRQAKRLFPLFGAGGILGLALGGLLTQPLVQWLGTENLLLAWAGTLILTLGLVQALMRGVTEGQTRSRRRSRLVDDLQQGYTFVRRSSLMRWISLAAVLFSVLFFSLAFPFAKAVAAQFPDEDALAGFLGVFQGTITAAAFLVSLLVANRLYARFGFMGALLVLPLIYLIGFGVLLVNAAFVVLVAFRFLQMFWMQGVAGSAYQALFNIVPGERREQTRAFIDGVPTQAGIVLIGVLLAIGEQNLQAQHMFLLGVVTAVLATLTVWQARRAYSGAVVEALHAGQPGVFFSEEEPFGGFRRDATAVAVAVAGISDPNPAVRRVAAEILGNLAVPEATDALVNALDDPDAEVRAALLRSLARAMAAPALLEVATYLRDPESLVRLEAVRALNRLTAYPRGLATHVQPLLSDLDPVVSSEVAVTLLQTGSYPQAVDVLHNMTLSSKPAIRVKALEALAAWGDPAAYDLAAAGLADSSPAVRGAAAMALAYIDPGRCLDSLIQTLGDEDSSVREAVAGAIGQIGAPALVPTMEALSDPALETGALLALSGLPVQRVAGRIHQYVQDRVNCALHYDELQGGLVPLQNGDDRMRLLIESLQDRARRHGLNALRGMGLLGDHDAIALAIDNLQSKDADQRANALEMLDSVGGRDIRPVLHLWEPAGTESTANQMETGRERAAEVLLSVLQDSDSWLRACAALVAGTLNLPQVQTELARLARSDPDALVQETATATLDGGLTVNTLPTLSIMERILFLRRVPLFAALSPVELKQVAGIAGEHFFVDGEFIARQDDPGDEMYIIVSGEIQVLVSDGDTTMELAQRKPGEYVGEMAIISQEPRMASLVAAGDVRVLCINQKQFEGILRERPETSLAVMRILCDRLKESQHLAQAHITAAS